MNRDIDQVKYEFCMRARGVAFASMQCTMSGYGACLTKVSPRTWWDRVKRWLNKWLRFNLEWSHRVEVVPVDVGEMLAAPKEGEEK